jgi:hypothetical protein
VVLMLPLVMSSGLPAFSEEHATSDAFSSVSSILIVPARRLLTVIVLVTGYF